MKISIQAEDFSLQQETDLLREKSNNLGALVTFTGLVRDLDNASKVSSLFLEHYPGMTDRSLEQISLQAKQRWNIISTTIIHRIGELQASDQIVFVGVTSLHRSEAFAGCEFIMDFLKTSAPFWKKSMGEKNAQGEQKGNWVEAKKTDELAAEKWKKKGTSEAKV